LDFENDTVLHAETTKFIETKLAPQQQEKTHGAQLSVHLSIVEFTSARKRKMLAGRDVHAVWQAFNESFDSAPGTSPMLVDETTPGGQEQARGGFLKRLLR